MFSWFIITAASDQTIICWLQPDNHKIWLESQVKISRGKKIFQHVERWTPSWLFLWQNVISSFLWYQNSKFRVPSFEGSPVKVVWCLPVRNYDNRYFIQSRVKPRIEFLYVQITTHRNLASPRIQSASAQLLFTSEYLREEAGNHPLVITRNYRSYFWL